MDGHISRETFEPIPINDKLNILFDIAKASWECACVLQVKIDVMERRIDRRRWFDTSVAAMTGFLGGASVWLIKSFGGNK